MIVVVALAVPALVRSLRRWNVDPLVRFGALGFAGTMTMFLLFPWKPAHLLPSLLTLVLWISASDRNRRSYLWLWSSAIALNGLVTLRLFAPDRPDARPVRPVRAGAVVGVARERHPVPGRVHGPGGRGGHPTPGRAPSSRCGAARRRHGRPGVIPAR